VTANGEPIEGFVDFLVTRGFSRAIDRYDASFNGYSILRKHLAVVAVTMDRGEWHIDVGRDGALVRCPDWVRALGDVLSNDSLNVQAETTFYERNWDSIMAIVADDRRFGVLPIHTFGIAPDRLNAILRDFHSRHPPA
jgi:hypothetical protein